MTHDLVALLGLRFGETNAAARSGDYSLLLGAGASIGAANAHGALLGAPKLVAALKQEFPSAPIDAKGNLQRAYQRAVSATSSSAVWHSLKKLYANADHQPWFTELAGLPWRRIWSLNIDDAFERAYRKTTRANRLRLRSVDWHEQYFESDELQLIHLHGSVQGPSPSRLVFSFSEYQNAAQARPVWDAMLRGLLGTKPIVIVGARVLDDPDVEAMVLSATRTDGPPSFIVDPFIDEGNAWELERLGYVVLRVTGEEFVAGWAQAFSLNEVDLAALYQAELVDLPQFNRLRVDHVVPPPRSHDFLGGNEPLWSDICADTAAEFSWVTSEIGAVQSWLAGPSNSVMVRTVFGDRFSGVSTGLLLVGRKAREAGAEVLQFDRSNRFNIARLLDYCRERGPVVILVDTAHDFADDLNEIAVRAQLQGDVKIALILTDRKYRDLSVTDRLTGSYIKSSNRVPHSLGRANAYRLVDLLGTQGRLGALEGLPQGQQTRHFSKRDVFSALAEVENAPGFGTRFASEMQKLTVGWHRELLVILAIAAPENREVGLIEASFALGVPQDKIHEDVQTNSNLNALIELVGDLLLPRQRITSLQQVGSERSSDDQLRALSRSLQRLAPLATRKGRRSRSRAANLVAQLMSARALADHFPDGDLEAFYESLRPTFGPSNARYWEQRAIHARLNAVWEKAESFAARAVSLSADSYTKTTYGVVLLGRSRSLLMQNDTLWLEYYRRGRGELLAAIASAQNLGGRARVTVFAYLEAALPVLEQSVERRRGADEVDEVADDWSSFYAMMRITQMESVGDGDSESRAQLLQRRYTGLQLLR